VSVNEQDNSDQNRGKWSVRYDSV